MEYRIKVNVWGGALVIALGVATSLVTSTIVASSAYKQKAAQQAREQRELTVRGSARLRVRSDLGVWRIGVRGDGVDLKSAYGALEFGVDRVQAFLAAQGFGDTDIGLSAIVTDTHYVRDKDGMETRQVAGYTMDRIFGVTTGDVDRVSRAAGRVTELLQDNVQVTSYAPQYTYSKAADLKIQILGLASEDARTRAEEIATKSGCVIGEVRKAQTGPIQITEPNSTEVSGGGIYDTSTIDKDVSVVVTVTFGIER